MDCIETVSELYMYISSVSRKRTIPNISKFTPVYFIWVYITLDFFGGCLMCLIVLVAKLLTGFIAFGPPLKVFALGVSVVILD